jgi:hypothetical protein
VLSAGNRRLRGPSRHSAGQASAAAGGTGLDSNAGADPDANTRAFAHAGRPQSNKS